MDENMGAPGSGAEANSQEAQRAAPPLRRQADLPSAAPQAREAPAEVRIVTEDAWCLGCGYDLRGLSVIHEPHYGWFVTKCSECGTVNPMHGFGRDRKAAKAASVNAAALWVIVGLAFATGWAGANFGVGQITFARLYDGGRQSIALSNAVEALFHQFWAVPHMLLAAAVFTALMPRRHKQRLLVVGLPVFGVSVLFWSIQIYDAYVGWGGMQARFLQAVWWWLLPLVLAIQVLMIIGADVAARWVLRKALAMIAPRSVVLGLSDLWKSYGQPLPRRITDPDG
jgi:hypothetical protein